LKTWCVTLESGGWSGKTREKRERGWVYMNILARHDAISHMLGIDACIRLFKGANGRNILKILRHEDLHCAMQNVLDDLNEDTLDKYLDYLPRGNWFRRMLLLG
jgi:hypothetical protein